MLKDKCKKEWSALVESGEVTLTLILTPTPTLTPTLTPTPTPTPTRTLTKAHVLYGDFMNPESDDYVCIPDMSKLIGAMNTHLEDYNAVSKVRATAGARVPLSLTPNPEPLTPNP